MAVLELSRPTGRAPQIDLDGVKLLVVAHEPASVERLRRQLRTSGATIVAASSAQEALQLLRSERPDVVACELDLPDCHGLHLMRRIRMRSRLEGGATPAIALTTQVSQSAHASALLAGYQAFVPIAADSIELAVAILGVVGAQRQPN